MRTAPEAKKNNSITRMQRVLMVGSGLLTLCVLIAISYAWFVRNRDFATVSHVLTPSDIIIAGEGGKDITEINLEYTDADVANDGRITVNRVVCVKSLKNTFYLELAHTTNIDGLQIELYPAIVSSTDEYKKDTTALTGDYLNKNTTVTEGTIAAASGNEYDKTYFETDSTKQKNAIPLYWLSEQQTAVTKMTDANYYMKYYVITASWKEEEKETDLVYLMASNELTTSSDD